MSQVKCSVDTCCYNSCNCCSAPEIKVCSCGCDCNTVSESSETACRTFRRK